MSKFCPRHTLFLFLLGFFMGFFSIKADQIRAAQVCGDGDCKGQENCTTCPEDCGACPTATPTSAPTSTPTSAPESTPTPTSASTSTDSSSSSSTGTTYYPSITLTRQGLLFSGTASISQGVIDSVEYSLDDGRTWSQATSKDEKFDEISDDYTFSPPSTLGIGIHKITARAKSLAGVYTEAANYASLTLTISAPKVILNKFSPNPTKNLTPTITGLVNSDILEISKVQISLDNGATWHPANLTGRAFSLTIKLFEDGNYPVKAKAFDIAGNTGESEIQILIVDTIPPIIGGSVTALGPQILTPNSSGAVRTVADAQNQIIISMRGGVTKAILDTQDKTFDLKPIESTNLWTGRVVFDREGEKPAKIIAVDGAGNRTERNLSPFLIEESGRAINIKDNAPVKNAEVDLFLFEITSKSWVLWDGSSFGQENPQQTDENGNYNYIVPAGRYYLEIKTPGFRTMRSEIFNLTTTTTLTAVFPLSPKPTINLRLPIIGRVNFVVPLPYPAQTLSKNEFWREEQTGTSLEFGLKKGSKLPDFSLPNLEGRTVSPATLKGKPLVLTFLSIWAPPSIEQAFVINETHRLLDENRTILAVFLQDSVGEVTTFMKRGNYNFNAVIDKDGITSALYRISTLPQHIFVDSKGVIFDTFTGVLSKEELLEKLGSLD